MSSAHRSWTGGTLTARSFLKPHHVARAVFHPTWIPEALDPTVETLKRVRVIAGAFAALGVYTYVEGGFDFDEVLGNAATASVVLFFLTPLTVAAMLFVWRRTGTVRQLKAPLVNSLKLLLLLVGSVFATVLLLRLSGAFGMLSTLLVGFVGLWMVLFVLAGAFKLTGNFFGTAAVHRCLPPLLATVTTWLMAVPDLVTGDLHGLSLTMGVVFILGAPVTVTAISLLEMRRLKRRYGIRLTAHPATLPPVPTQGGPVPQGNPFQQGPPYPPYAPPPQNPYGPYNPYGPHTYGSNSPHNGQNPYGG
ncbi:hypothetical protein OG562_09175 [Streptomyces sp. NBC_01275]|uniref:hypothetical protein n=1 Tax=Streptomyces sp. NBC_01275 TaxID=2903807 RepID=UPI002252D4A5|nr:hypothetical protein [Streptomyces sp. NBC_01275]MCX4761140.1 hypothetical protein [Streptomyces sp. NBC_01275]